MSKRTARQPKVAVSSPHETSAARIAVAVLLVVAGIAWIAVYVNLAKDAAMFVDFPGAEAPRDPLPWMSDLGRYNFLIGFLAIALGLTVAAHRSTPLGRGRGVLVGMLGCFLFGLVWIVTFYFIGLDGVVPVMKDLDQYNLLLGIGFMAIGFTFATKWE